MKLRLVRTFAPLTQAGDIPIPAGRYAGLTVHWTGTVRGQHTFDWDDLGVLLVRHRGRNIVNARARDLYCYDELAGGYARFIVTHEGAVDVFLFIPFRYGEMPGGKDDNLLNCGPDELYITIPQMSAADYSTAECTVSRVEALGVSRYIPQITSQNVLLTANEPVRLQVPNMRRLLLDLADFTDPAESIFLLRNGNEICFEGPQAELEAWSDLQWYREAADLEAVMAELGRDDFASFVGGRYEFRLIGAAGNAHVTEFGAIPVSVAEFQAVKAIESAGMANQYAGSPQPPSGEVAPADPETASSAFGLASGGIATKQPSEDQTIQPVKTPPFSLASGRKVGL